MSNGHGGTGDYLRELYRQAGRDYPAVPHSRRRGRRRRPELLARLDYLIGGLWAVVAVVPLVAGIHLLDAGRPLGWAALAVAGLLAIAAGVVLTGAFDLALAAYRRRRARRDVGREG